jgi:hypothetical protein
MEGEKFLQIYIPLWELASTRCWLVVKNTSDHLNENYIYATLR